MLRVPDVAILRRRMATIVLGQAERPAEPAGLPCVARVHARPSPISAATRREIDCAQPEHTPGYSSQEPGYSSQEIEEPFELQIYLPFVF